ncbi:MAG: transglutaminase-like cysteine peptidase [Noviherbaspirillum sp.]
MDVRRAVRLLFLLLACLASFAWPEPAGLSFPAEVLARAERKYGAAARGRLLDWQRLVADARGKAEPEKLALVNDFFNRVPFLSDAEHWGREDYWATPAEMLASFGGDCEDFSIAKYFTLVALGVPVDKLKITYVRAKMLSPGNQAHMVLTYYATPAAIPAVLDNLVPEIRPASARPDLVPVYSFNGDGLWLARERGDGKAVAGGSGNIGFWRELKARLGKEFE